jgi:hypothetical protein
VECMLKNLAPITALLLFSRKRNEILTGIFIIGIFTKIDPGGDRERSQSGFGFLLI